MLHGSIYYKFLPSQMLSKGSKEMKITSMNLRLHTGWSITSQTQHHEQSQVLLAIQGAVTLHNLAQHNKTTDWTGIVVHTVICAMECL